MGKKKRACEIASDSIGYLGGCSFPGILAVEAVATGDLSKGLVFTLGAKGRIREKRRGRENR